VRQVRVHGADGVPVTVGVAEADGFTEVGAADVGVVLGFVVLGAAEVGQWLGQWDGLVLEAGALGVVEAVTVTEALALPVGVIVTVGLVLADGDQDGHQVGQPDVLPDGEPEALGVPVSDGDPVGRPVGVSDADGLPVGRPVGVGVPEGSTEVTVSVGTGIVGPPLLSAGFGASDVGDSDGVGVVGEDVGFCVGGGVGLAEVVVGDALGFAGAVDFVGAALVGATLGVVDAVVGLCEVG
jgi:hypothetical protein